MPERTSAIRRLALALIVVASLALGSYAAHRFLRTESVMEKVAVTRIEDAKELAARRRDAIGTFATGATLGERTIVVGADGRVEFDEIGADPATSRTTDTWELARRGKNFCLATPASGVIDIINIDTLMYFGNEYRRTK